MARQAKTEDVEMKISQPYFGSFDKKRSYKIGFPETSQNLMSF